MVSITNKGIKPEDFKKLRAESSEIYFNWLTEDVTLEVRISKRMKKNNGKARYSYKNQTGEIILSHKHYMSFGIDSLIYVLRHEYAHIINCYQNDRVSQGHDKNFKELCRKLGGKMNKNLAGKEFADCAWENYIKKKKKFRLTCPSCGNIIERDRISNKLTENYRCGGCKTPLKDFTVTKNN